MKAMIMAAGLGTRLKPFTASMPKALVPVGDIPMLQRVITRLRSGGVSDVIINLHHFGGQIREFCGKNNNFGINISFSDESERLLDTGGGLMKASDFFRDGNPFVVHNADVLSFTDLSRLRSVMEQSSPLAVLVCKPRKSSRMLIFDSSLVLCGWQNTTTGEIIMARECRNPVKLAFSGIQIIHPMIFDLVRFSGVFSLISLYLDLAAKYDIVAYPDEQPWFDLGTTESIKKAEEFMLMNPYYE